jgi:hypothetical protein
MRGICALLMLSCVSFIQSTALAQKMEQTVQLHGFGSWAYGNTDGNAYLSGSHNGRYDDAAFALNVVANVRDRLRVVAQPELRDEEGETEVELDYAFAEWTFSDELKLRAGKVKLPFGISTEVFDVGTLRPFKELPQAIYGFLGIVGESYKGIGFTGRLALGHGWELSYDLYGGGQELEKYTAPEAVVLGEDVEEPSVFESSRDVVGGRVAFETPVLGLQVGASASTGQRDDEKRRTGLGVQAEYQSGHWSIRSEYAHNAVENEVDADGFYAEAAYRLDSHWQVAGQYGHFTSELSGAPEPAGPSLLRHEEIAIGLNYWWSPDLVLKLSYHNVDGNRLAGPAPEDLAESVTSGTLKERTNLLLVSAQFSF